MMPAAPLVGAVTTRPPAAFSSLTASAYRFTQSSTVSGSFIAASGAPSSRVQRRRAPRDVQAAGQGAGLRMPRATQACIAAQSSSQAGVDLLVAAPDSLVGAASVRRCSAGARAVRKQRRRWEGIRHRGGVGDDAVLGASSWLTTKPPPTE
jgi:hypothetical protein